MALDIIGSGKEENEILNPSKEEDVNTLAPESSEIEPEEEKIEEHLEPNGLPKELNDAIITLHNYYRLEDQGLRDLMIAFWKRLDLMWQGIDRVFWDARANDWRRIDDNNAESMIGNLDPVLYDKIINIYRAHGESLIAALSVKLPSVIFYPDDADVSEDVDTANAYSKIASLIEKHNKGTLKFIKAVWILFNQGVVAAYVYNRAKKAHGTVRVPKYGPDTTVYYNSFTCPLCNQVMKEEESKEQPIELDDEIEVKCNSCGGIVHPNNSVTEELLPTIIGYTDEPKSRTSIDIFSPTYAQMPFYARNQEQMPYIALRFEQHNALLRELYPDYKDKLPINSGSNQAYDAFYRSYSPWQYSYSSDLSTVTSRWLRPWAYNVLADDALIEKMKARFPDGCYATIVKDDLVVDARNECLDEHWAISVCPTSEYIHADPLGKPLAPVQEIENEINDLTLETFEHSIPETFADPIALNFSKYSQAKAQPGTIYQAKMPPNRNLADAFHSLKTATLSEEMKMYSDSMNAKGQFVVGDFPSVFGGPNTTGSKTASEYTESRASALQRLNTVWSLLKFFWSDVISIAVPLYVKDMIDDDKIVEKTDKTSSGYINNWIRLTELTGKVGKVEPDATEELPTSYSAMKGVVMELVSLNNDFVNEGLFHSQNTPLLKRIIGLPDLYIPGQADRDKQFNEFSILLKSPPLEDGMPTVMPEDGIDDNLVHIQTCRLFLVGATGVALKQTNPAGRMNIIAHMKAHIMLEQQKMAAQTEGNVKPNNDDSAIAEARS